jgi:hypothetical protein
VAAGCNLKEGASLPSTPDLGVSGTDMSACIAIVTITASSPFAPATLVATTGPHLGRPVWSVTLAGGGTFTPDVSGDPSGLRAELQATQPGSYTFSVQFVGGASCFGHNTVELVNPTGRAVTYRLRVSPPEASGLPQQDLLVTIFGGTPIGGRDLLLDRGTPLAGTLAGPAGPIAGEVRLVADSGPDAVALVPSTGAFQLAVRADGLYTPLLIPASTALAPRLAPQASGAALAGAAFTVGAGEPVGGSVTDAAGAPIAGVRLVLRAGLLPSGVGASASDGTFALRAQAGSYALQSGAPGWAELALDGVAIAPGGTTLAASYLVGRLAAGGRVVASDGTTPVGGARVRVRSAPLAGVATVAVGVGAPQPATARVSETLVSAADGTLPPWWLPAAPAPYDVDLLIEPPAGAADGMTALTAHVPGAPAPTLRLAPRVALTGRVTDLAGQPVASARVTAFESLGLGAAPSTTTGTDGRYRLMVDAAAPLALLVEPGAAAMLASARLAVGAGGGTADVALPRGLLVSGLVRGPAAPLPSVLIEALCESCGSTTPIASTVSDDQGNYRLYLPDPGETPFDGGASD